MSTEAKPYPSSLDDVIAYLKLRVQMVSAHGAIESKRGRVEYTEHTQGILYGFTQSIQSLERLKERLANPVPPAPTQSVPDTESIHSA